MSKEENITSVDKANEMPSPQIEIINSGLKTETDKIDNNNEKEDTTTDEYVFVNYRCRKCDGYISKQMDKKMLNCIMGSKGTVASNKTPFHKNCSVGIEDGEHVCFDMISYSDKPLSIAKDIVYMEDYKK